MDLATNFSETGDNLLEIALCDDDECILNQLNTMIIEYFKKKGVKVITRTYASGEELLQGSKKFHVIFLDIKMDKINGIETARIIRRKDKRVKIIYITNSSNYQNDAFSVRAFGYIIKPITYEAVYEQLDDAIEYSQIDKSNIAFTFNTDMGIKTLNVEAIYYFESYNHKIQIVTKDKTLKVSDNINNILNAFKPYGFSMPHKSFVINLLYVSSIKGYDVTLTNGNLIPISQKRAVQFKAEFHSFLKNNFNLLIEG